MKIQDFTGDNLPLSVMIANRAIPTTGKILQQFQNLALVKLSRPGLTSSQQETAIFYIKIDASGNPYLDPAEIEVNDKGYKSGPQNMVQTVFNKIVEELKEKHEAKEKAENLRIEAEKLSAEKVEKKNEALRFFQDTINRSREELKTLAKEVGFENLVINQITKTQEKQVDQILRTIHLCETLKTLMI